jgi:hypothetical protein
MERINCSVAHSFYPFFLKELWFLALYLLIILLYVATSAQTIGPNDYAVFNMWIAYLESLEWNI